MGRGGLVLSLIHSRLLDKLNATRRHLRSRLLHLHTKSILCESASVRRGRHRPAKARGPSVSSVVSRHPDSESVCLSFLSLPLARPVSVAVRSVACCLLLQSRSEAPKHPNTQTPPTDAPPPGISLLKSVNVNSHATLFLLFTV